MPIFLILAVIIAIIAVTFALQNAIMVTVSLLFLEFESSLALVLLMTLGIGILVGFLGILPTVIKQRLEISRQRKKILAFENQPKSTAALPDTGTLPNELISDDPNLPVQQ